MRIGVYQSYWGSIGGGQRYLGAVAELLSRDNQVEIVHHCDRFSREAIEEALELDLSRVQFRWMARPCRPTLNGNGVWSRYQTERQWCAEISRPYDLFIHCTNGVPFFAHAGRSVLITYFPELSADEFHGRTTAEWKDRSLPMKTIARTFHAWEWKRRYATYDLCLTCSEYSRHWLRKSWGLNASVVYPPLRNGFQPREKQPIILSVGRFDASEHKRQDVMIDAFIRLCDQGLRGWRYMMLGPLTEGAESDAYLLRLQELAKGYPIEFHTNVKGEELREALEVASILWHSMGYGVDAEKNPGRLEHFGMVATEAMAAGSVPIVFDGGGLTEIVRHEVDGFRWRMPNQLADYARMIIEDSVLHERLGESARQRASSFSRDAFESRLLDVLSPLLS